MENGRRVGAVSPRRIVLKRKALASPSSPSTASTSTSTAIPKIAGNDQNDTESSRSTAKMLDLGEQVKRARSIINSTVSSKPAKLARYDQQHSQNGNGEAFETGRSMFGGSPTYMSSSSFHAVIPLNALNMEQRHTPLDVGAFLSRVATFDLRLWSRKPDQLCSFQCARYGWRIAAKNSLLCVSCRCLLSIPQDNGSAKLSDWVANIEQQIRKTGHLTDCIWIKSPSPINILLLPEGNDMQSYMKQTAASFSRIKTLPILTSRYRLIMDLLDMTGLRDKAGLNLQQHIEGTCPQSVEQTVLFLMLNGWMMDESGINALKCQLCLRQVPLWLCFPAPALSDIQDLLSPQKNNPLGNAHSNMKELDPLTSHWFWCPWRKILHRVDPNKKLENFLEMDGTNLFSESTLNDDILPHIDAYMKLAVKVDYDFKRGRLLNGPTLELSDNAVAATVINNFKELLNSATGNSVANQPILTDASNTSLENDIVTIRPTRMRSVARNLFEESSRDSLSIAGQLILHSEDTIDQEIRQQQIDESNATTEKQSTEDELENALISDDTVVPSTDVHVETEQKNDNQTKIEIGVIQSQDYSSSTAEKLSDYTIDKEIELQQNQQINKSSPIIEKQGTEDELENALISDDMVVPNTEVEVVKQQNDFHNKVEIEVNQSEEIAIKASETLHHDDEPTQPKQVEHDESLSTSNMEEQIEIDSNSHQNVSDSLPVVPMMIEEEYVDDEMKCDSEPIETIHNDENQIESFTHETEEANHFSVECDIARDDNNQSAESAHIEIEDECSKITEEINSLPLPQEDSNEHETILNNSNERSQDACEVETETEKTEQTNIDDHILPTSLENVDQELENHSDADPKEAKDHLSTEPEKPQMEVEEMETTGMNMNDTDSDNEQDSVQSESEPSPALPFHEEEENAEEEEHDEMEEEENCEEEEEYEENSPRPQDTGACTDSDDSDIICLD